MTDEDLVPKWLGGVLEAAFPSPAGYEQALGTTNEAGPIDARRRFRNKPRYEVRAVCAACNNGWMSRLEQEARPWLEPLVRGDLATVTMEGQATLAHWISKVAALLDVVDPGVLSGADRRAICVSGHPPMGSHARVAYWEGEVEGPFEVFWTAHAARRPDEPHHEHPNSMSATIRVGRGVLTFVGGAGIELATSRWTTGQARFPLTVWPPTPSGIAWPPAHPLLRSREELLAFHESFWVRIMNPDFPRPDARQMVQDQVRSLRPDQPPMGEPTDR